MEVAVFVQADRLAKQLLRDAEQLGKRIIFGAAVGNRSFQLIFGDELFYCPFIGGVFVLLLYIERRIDIIKRACHTVPELVGKFCFAFRHRCDTAGIDCYMTAAVRAVAKREGGSL